MPLTNSQYDAVLRIYSERQLRNRREQEARIREAYAAIPRLSEIDSEIAALSLKKARILLSRRTGPDFDLSAAIGELSEERTALLLANGYSADFLDLHYDCPLCRGHRLPQMAGNAPASGVRRQNSSTNSPTEGNSSGR